MWASHARDEARMADARADSANARQDVAAEIQATLQAKDERISGLQDELARASQQYQAGLIELDGLRKHSPLQIDQARGETRHWKAEFERVDAENKSTVEQYRQRASTLGNDLAATRARLQAVEEALAASRLRVVELEQKPVDTEAVRQRPGAVAKRGIKKSVMVGALRRRKIA